MFSKVSSWLLLFALYQDRLQQWHFCTNTMLGTKNTAGVMEGRHGTRKWFCKPSPEKWMRWRVYSQLAEQSQTRTPLGLCGVWQGVTARERRQSSFCQLQDPLTAGETTVTGAGASGVQSGGRSGGWTGELSRGEVLCISLQHRKL